ncbi:MAG TPA: acyl carrier protein [Vicinamibacterales bacterium]|jgi:acyl carrier protein
MTNATESLHGRLAAIFADQLHVDVPAPDTDLFATARLDSLGVVELVLELEQQFGISIATDDLELDHFRSLDAIAQFVAARISGASVEEKRRRAG